MTTVRKIRTVPYSGPVTRRQVAAAIRKVMAQRDGATVSILAPKRSERKTALARK